MTTRLIRTSIVASLWLAFGLAASAQAQSLMVWGDDTHRQETDAPTGDVRAVSGGAINGIALRRDGTPFLWGGGPIGPTPIPADLADQRFYAVSLGRDNAVLIRTDGTLAAFGRSPLIGNVPAGSYNAVAVAAAHAVAIADDGTLKAWGSDTSGTLAGLLGAPSGGPFSEIEANTLYSLALHGDGTLYGWGHGAQGTFVLAGWTPSPESPGVVHVPGQRFKAIAAGNIHALAIREDGTVTGWGNAATGALHPPTHVRFKAVAAGWGFSVGLSTDGTLWGWGTPHFLFAPFPTQAWTFASEGWTRYGDSPHYYVAGVRFKDVEAAAFHIMAITAGRAGR